VVLAALAIALPSNRAFATPVGTAFTYQGVVQKNGVNITGACSIRFTLYDAVTAGAVAGSPSQNTVAVTASNGLFTTTLDFGATAFNGNNARWLEIEVEGPGDVSYTLLSPRQPVSPAPYAIFALNGGGGSLTLPFAGSASSVNPAFSVTNPNASGSAVYGDGGLAGIEGTGGGFAGVYGHSTIQYGVYGSTTAGASGGVRGANFGSGPGVEGVGGSGATGYGVQGTSGSAPGVYGTSFGTAGGVYGINSAGTGAGVEGHSTNGFGVYGTASAASKAGVFGQMFIDNTAGVLGRSESSGQNAQAVFGYASNTAVGVLGISEGNDGIQARSNAGGKSGIWGYSTSPTGYGGAFSNSAGGVALLVSGLEQVGTLQITGADLAESFPVGGEKLEPGTVLEIVGDEKGTLRESRSAYNTRVAGVVSGANGMPAGVILEGHDFEQAGKAQVAMSGRVWVKCDARSAPIHAGDLLTTSDAPGYAMRASDPARATGAILGKAMNNLESGRGLVLVLVSLQ
ncbi:MAG: hypothetical protein ACRENS_12245, partial [Candidatus Eiseniibacteriota bacterium]